ncbi:hypothetical protein HAX54_040833 [Datura stramonium]|uniref:Uncharacterized protein n=1 Tax=Datura stramonium TaxID=4076 RepID=A0ABS8VNS4_DATST|nr:hypothetical protein [Datura stramonium]
MSHLLPKGDSKVDELSSGRQIVTLVKACHFDHQRAARPNHRISRLDCKNILGVDLERDKSSVMDLVEVTSICCPLGRAMGYSFDYWEEELLDGVSVDATFVERARDKIEANLVAALVVGS